MTKIGFKIKVHRSEGCHMLSTGIYRLLWLNLTSPVRLERTTCNHLQLQKHTVNKKKLHHMPEGYRSRAHVGTVYTALYSIFFRFWSRSARQKHHVWLSEITRFAAQRSCSPASPSRSWYKPHNFLGSPCLWLWPYTVYTPTYQMVNCTWFLPSLVSSQLVLVATIFL